jgi:hypothetical protein
MLRSVAARRCLGACLVLFIVLATAGPALAAGRSVREEPTGPVDQLVAWMVSVWSSAGSLLEEEPPVGTESLEGGCTVDPSGGCHGAIVSPGSEGS